MHARGVPHVGSGLVFVRTCFPRPAARPRVIRGPPFPGTLRRPPRQKARMERPSRTQSSNRCRRPASPAPDHPVSRNVAPLSWRPPLGPDSAPARLSADGQQGRWGGWISELARRRVVRVRPPPRVKPRAPRLAWPAFLGRLATPSRHRPPLPTASPSRRGPRLIQPPAPLRRAGGCFRLPTRARWSAVLVMRPSMAGPQQVLGPSGHDQQGFEQSLRAGGMWFRVISVDRGLEGEPQRPSAWNSLQAVSAPDSLVRQLLWKDNAAVLFLSWCTKSPP